MEKKIEQVSIEIKQATFLILRLLPNKVWNILAEYVDNSLSSNRIERKELKKIGGPRFCVKIDINDKFIKIYDNAGGINSTEFERALELANLPKNKSELNEFGMGMKTSSIWLGDVWTLRSAPINETVERSIEFDLNKVVDNEIKSLKVKSVKKNKREHFTEIVIRNLSENAPSSYQFDKIKDHLSSIYRIPIRSGEMQLFFNGVLLKYEDPKILKAPPVKSPNGKPVMWKYPIDFPLGNKYRIKGFVAILEKMSNSLSGLSLFKKGRVIQGSHDEKYRPDVLFGKDPGSALYKGLFGELELIGFDVTYNKGTFRDVDSLEKVMSEINKILSSPKINFIKQAEDFSRAATKQNSLKAAEKLFDTIEEERKRNPLKEKVRQLVKASSNKKQNKINDEKFRKARPITTKLKGEIIEFGDKEFNLSMSLVSTPKVETLFSIYEEGNKKGVKQIHYKINLAHPFFSKHSKVLKNNYGPIKDLLEAFVIAEITTEGVVKFGDKIRDTFNNYLKGVN